MKRNNKKGFTIVELVIVIAVIAILSAVLIPTFSGIVKKARLSTDQQAVRQMNTVLAAEKITNDDMNIFDAFAVLEDGGLSAKNYKALSSGMSFFWDSEINRVLMVKDGVATYPEEYKGRTNKGNWQSLTQKIETKKVDISSGAAAVSSGAELAYVVDKANDNKEVSSIALNDRKVDMMGAALTIDKVAANKTLTIANGTIENATAVEAKTTGKGNNSGNDGIYNMGMITKIEEGATVTLSKVTIKNMNLKDTNAGNCAFLVGTLSGTLILEDVTIEDSSIIGYTSVGSLVGYLTSTGSIEIRGTLTIKNVEVQGIGGRIGQLVGYYNSAAGKISLADGASVVITNVTNTIYKCEQNTGACVVDGCEHGALGLDNGIIHSWQIDGKDGLNCEKKANRAFYENSLVGYAATKTDGNITDNINTSLKTVLGLN